MACDNAPSGEPKSFVEKLEYKQLRLNDELDKVSKAKAFLAANPGAMEALELLRQL